MKSREELLAAIEKIVAESKYNDLIVRYDFEKDEDRIYLEPHQVDLVRKIFEMFREVRWAAAFQDYKMLEFVPSTALEESALSGKIGDLVRVTPVSDRYEGKTYLGILIGDIATYIDHSMSGDVVRYRFSGHNPAIFVPELREIIFGYESWWCKVEDGSDLSRDITDEDIRNVWYVRVLRELYGERSGDGEDNGE